MCNLPITKKKNKTRQKKIGEIGKEDIDPELMCNKSIPQVTYKKKKKIYTSSCGRNTSSRSVTS